MYNGFLLLFCCCYCCCCCCFCWGLWLILFVVVTSVSHSTSHTLTCAPIHTHAHAHAHARAHVHSSTLTCTHALSHSDTFSRTNNTTTHRQQTKQQQISHPQHHSIEITPTTQPKTTHTHHITHRFQAVSAAISRMGGWRELPRKLGGMDATKRCVYRM